MLNRRSRRRGALSTAVAAAVLVFAATLCLSVGARAANITDRPFLFSFDGHDTTAGRFGSVHENQWLNAVAVDNGAGAVYVVDASREAVDRFDYKGHAASFSAGPAAGRSSLYGPPGKLFKEQSSGFFNFFVDVAVDDSGGAGGSGEGEQGRLYVSSSGGPIDAFKPNGEYLWELPKTSVEGVCGIAVDHEGHLWVGMGGHHEVREFANSGGPPVQIGSFAVTSGNRDACRLAVDRAATGFYLAFAWGSYDGGSPDLEKYVSGSFDSVLGDSPTHGVAVDQSSATGHVFALQRSPQLGDQFTSLREYEPCATAGCAGSEVAGSPFGHGAIANGEGVAYSTFEPPGEGPLDRLYVSDSKTATVDVFGPLTTGPVPSGGCTGASVLKRTEATLTCTVNPQGLANSYHLEWVKGSAQKLTVEATGGSFALTLPAANGMGTTSAGSDTISEAKAVFGAFHVGDAIAGQGIPGGGATGDLTAGSKAIKLDSVSGANPPLVGEGIGGNGIPAGATIAEVGPGTLTISAPATATASFVALRRFSRVTAVGPGTLTISNAATATTKIALGTTESTGPVAWDAPASEGEGSGSVEGALRALPAGAGNVSVTGRPADASGVPGEYRVVFEGALAARRTGIFEAMSSLTGPGIELASTSHTGLSLSSATVGGEGWAGAGSQPAPYPSVSPPNSSENPVSIHVGGLTGGTTYDARLVATNEEAGMNGLSSYSAPFVFTTETPPVPAISGVSVSAVTTGSAHVAASIDPQEDQTSWVVQVSTDPACKTGFSHEQSRTIPAGETGGVSVAYDLSGLLEAQHYCVRILATDSGGTAISEVKQFETLAVAAGPAEAAFVAPRSDTSARLNAYVDPKGAPLSYRFEYSGDGGATWTALPLETDDRRLRGASVVVAEQLDGLAPGHEYSYRLASMQAHGAEGSGGSSPSLGGVRTFTTRSRAEMEELDPSSCPNEEARAFQRSGYLPQCRGFELVNSPEKGNQNVRSYVGDESSPVRSDGERAVWEVAGGAPGGNVGTGAAFLATRTPTGWSSKALVPPGPEQVEGENGGYGLAATSTDFSKFIFVTGTQYASQNPCGHTFVRLDEAQHQEVLAHYDFGQYGSAQCPTGVGLEVSNDAAHVLLVPTDPKALSTQMLEDIGTPGRPETLSYLPDGTKPECGLQQEGWSFSGKGNGFAAGATWRPGYERIAVADAARAYFQVHPDGECNGSAAWLIFERDREARKGKGETLVVAPPDSQNAMIRSTPDGRSLYYLTSSACRKPRQASPYDCETAETNDTNGHLDIYRWDEAGGESTCLTCKLDNEAGETVTDTNMLEEGGAVMLSQDFSHAYFESRAKLSPRATAGDINLYALDLTARQVRFVADPNANVLENFYRGNSDLSANGDVLVFRTDERTEGNHELTADRLAVGCSNAHTRGNSEPCSEIFRYDYRDGSLECVSCLRGGTTTASAGGRDPSEGFLKVSGDGETVAFLTTQALSTQDVNNGLDLYEWRAGAQRLVTDGVSGFEQPGGGALRIYSVDDSGRNIFFAVTDPGLTGFEHDGFANLYDARVDGGFLPPGAPEACVEDSCQGLLQAAPFAVQPDSAFPIANGNVAAPVGPVAKPKSLTRAQRLANALKACRKRYARSKRRRLACERQARRRYGAKSRKTARSRRGARRRK